MVWLNRAGARFGPSPLPRWPALTLCLNINRGSDGVPDSKTLGWLLESNGVQVNRALAHLFKRARARISVPCPGTVQSAHTSQKNHALGGNRARARFGFPSVSTPSESFNIFSTNRIFHILPFCRIQFITRHNKTMTMTMPNSCETLCIQIFEDVEESGLFVVRVACTDRFLLGYWWNTEPFQNELLEQTGTVRSTRPDHSLGLEFVLRVRHRAPGLENAHYWSPFILRLCLDALRFRFLLPPQAQSMGIQEAMQETGELVLQRWTMQNPI